jgi:hypothetical protein
LIPFFAGFFTTGIGAILHTLSFALTGSLSGTVIKDVVLMAIMVNGEVLLADPFFNHILADVSLYPLLSPGT